MVPIDRPGAFRANITSFAVKEMDSGAIAVAITAELMSMYSESEGAWHQWPGGGYECSGDVWIVKKKESGGGINENGVRSLVDFAGWDGNIESVVNATWKPTPCVVIVQESEYKGQKSLKIAFVNDYNRTPGAQGNVDAAKAKALQSQYGAQFRALAANKQRNGTPPANRPAPPPPVNTKQQPQDLSNAHTDEQGNPLPF